MVGQPQLIMDTIFARPTAQETQKEKDENIFGNQSWNLAEQGHRGQKWQ